MRFIYCPGNPEHFATNLRRDAAGKCLMWDNAPGQEVLLVQTAFGKFPAEDGTAMCAALSAAELQPGRFTEFGTGMWARFVSPGDKARLGGCPLNGEASCYTVFAVERAGDECRVLAPPKQAMISASCQIPQEIHVEIGRQMRTEGRLFKREVDTGFFAVRFPAGLGKGYVDGDMEYEIDGFRIPVTRRMLEQQVFYVKSGTRPRLESRNRGLKLI